MAAAAVLTATMAACSTDVSLSELDPTRKIATLTRPTWLTYSGHVEELTLRPVVETDLVGREGQCTAGAATGEPGQVGISLQMTECEVVSRAGAPDNVEFAINERGERAVVLTFMRGPRPGIYRFAAGRLNSIERAPEPPAPAKPQKQAPAKKSRV